jgi:hypothetical protein
MYIVRCSTVYIRWYIPFVDKQNRLVDRTDNISDIWIWKSVGGHVANKYCMES